MTGTKFQVIAILGFAEIDDMIAKFDKRVTPSLLIGVATDENQLLLG